MAGDHAVVVQAHQLDHVVDVVLVLDPPRRVARLAREDRVVVDAALLEQLRPDRLWEAAVEGVVAVQVAELPPARG